MDRPQMTILAEPWSTTKDPCLAPRTTAYAEVSLTVLVLEKTPSGLKGEVSKWLLAVAAGVFVGCPSKLVRERLLSLTIGKIGKEGRCLMLWSAPTEQGYEIRAWGDINRVLDLEGVFLSKIR